MSVVLFLNLTEPQTFEAVLRPLIDSIKKQIDAAKIKSSSTFAVASSVCILLWFKVELKLQAPDGCFAIGVPVAFVGARYDEFQVTVELVGCYD